MSEVLRKYKEQANRYTFPYHHIPYFDEHGRVMRSRFLSWGFEYLCYMQHIVNILERIRPDSLLDVGCGDGRLFNMLRTPIQRMVGVDLVESAVNFARGFNPGAEFFVRDAKDLNEQFEVVTAIEVLEHIPDEEVSPFLRVLAERVRTNGHVVISVPSKAISLQRKHFRHYDIRLLNEQLTVSEAQLKIVSYKYVYGENVFVRLMNRLMVNRFWHLDIRVVNRLLWSYIWRYLRIQREGRGRHLVVLLRKT